MFSRVNWQAQFSQTAMFGKFARSQMRVLYRKLYRKFYVATLEERERAVLSWWLAIPRELNPRILRSIERFPDFVIYSDAASTGHRMAALLFKGGRRGAPHILRAAASAAPKYWADAFSNTNLIYGLELLALLAFIYMLRFALKGCSINCYLDNNNSLSALIKGDSNTHVIAAMVATFWRVLQKFNIDIFLGRVSSKLNIADHPTRSKSELPYGFDSLTEFNELFRMLTIIKRAHQNLFLPNDLVKNLSLRS